MTTWAPAVVPPALLPPPPPHHHHHRWRRHPSSAPLFPAATRMCSNRTTAATCNPLFSYPSGGPPRRRRRTRTSSSSSSCLLLRQESAPPLRRFSPLLLPPPRKNDPLELPPWRSPGRSSGISRVWEEAGGDAEVAVVEDDEEAGTAVLEAEIYDFMLGSPNPGDFPTKEQLIAAGRTDLVEAIASHGGWLAFGWDLDDDEEEEGAEQVQRRDYGLEQGRKAGGEASTSQSEHGNAAGWVDDAIFGHQRFSATTEPASSSAASVSEKWRVGKSLGSRAF